MRFAIKTEHGEVPVRLDARVDRVAEIILERIPWTTRRHRSKREHHEYIRERAYCVAWRQLRDFVEQALLAVETGLYDLAGAFMASMEVWDDEYNAVVTMQELVARRMAMIPSRAGGPLRLQPGPRND